MKNTFPPDGRLKELLPPQRPSADTIYVPSQFAISFVHKGQPYVFHTLTKQCAETALPSVCRGEEGYDELIEGYFLVPQGKDECALYERISALVRTFYGREIPRSVTILPTFACNARCVYCYEESTAPVTMTRETEEQTVRYLLSTLRTGRKLHISWFGGEPLLGEETIDRISQRLAEAGVDYSSSMISNGSLITPAVIEKMVGLWRLEHIQISMDGAEADSIARKRYRTYHDEYHAVMDAISRMSEVGIRVNVRCNVDEENLSRLPQYLKDMENGVAHKANVTINFAALFDLRRKENDLTFAKQLLPHWEQISAHGFRSVPLWPLDTKLRVFHCMADRGSPVICPGGSLYPCEHCPPEARYGDVRNGVTDEAARNAFCRTDRTAAQCRTCPFLPDCTSFADCPIKDLHCREVRALYTEYFLRRLIDKKDAGESEERPVC